jgi:hypothetical protein
VDLHAATGDEKYLKPLPAAIDWLKRSEIGPRKWARFYELGSNKPLYFTKDYKLVYTDDDLPTHYGFQGEFGIPAAISYRDGSKTTPKSPKQPSDTQIRTIIGTLDEKGRWLRNGRIETRVFIENVNTLCDYLQAQ